MDAAGVETRWHKGNRIEMPKSFIVAFCFCIILLNNLVTAAGCFGMSLAEKKEKEFTKAEAFCIKFTKEDCAGKSVNKKYFTYYCKLNKEGRCRPGSKRDN
uniref:BPTI/Kunitz inhibitor domain-containing protein n=1 Tax=Globodera pallida TaxID=36090 RepID=A0A183CDM8_GLOPA